MVRIQLDRCGPDACGEFSTPTSARTERLEIQWIPSSRGIACRLLQKCRARLPLYALQPTVANGTSPSRSLYRATCAELHGGSRQIRTLLRYMRQGARSSAMKDGHRETPIRSWNTAQDDEDWLRTAILRRPRHACELTVVDQARCRVATRMKVPLAEVISCLA